MRPLSFCVAVMLVIALMFSCGDRSRSREIDTAFDICESDPDSALNILSSIPKEELCKSILPVYCLAYTIALDKSGIDVDNDSLIRIAFESFADNTQGPYYSRAQYYMGKYYFLNDSIERALACFDKAKDCALQLNDTSLLCLALEKQSDAMLYFDRLKALEYACSADSLYSLYSARKITNQVYAKLQICFCLIANERYLDALDVNHKTLSLALGGDDSVAISSVYQDLALLYGKLGMYDSCLVAAKNSKQYCCENGLSGSLILADAYLAVDSFHQAQSLYLSLLNSANYTETYTIYTRLHEMALKTDDRNGAVAYADSAYQSLDKMYSESLVQRNLHYERLLSQEKEKNIIIQKSIQIKWIAGLVLLMLCGLGYAYITTRKRAQERLRMESEKAAIVLKLEREMHEKELAINMEQHRKDLKYRDLQIDIMQKYLMEKIKIAQKIQSVKDGRNKAVFSDADWVEIELFLENSECQFVSRLRASFPELREQDVRLMMMLRLKMPQKCIAEGYGISEKSIKQKLFLYKTKVGIQNTNTSLREFIESF